MENKNFNWRPMSEYTGGRVLATNGLDVLIGEINSEGDCESEEDSGTILCGITGFIKIEEMLPELKESEDKKVKKEIKQFIRSRGMQLAQSKVESWIAWLEKQGEKKPCMIQWTGDNLKEVIAFVGKCDMFDKWFKTWEEYEEYVHKHDNIFKLFNEDGSHYEVPVGAWIVKTPDGYNVASKCSFVSKFFEWSEEDEQVRQEMIKESGDELAMEIESLSKRYPEVSYAKLSRIAVTIAKWQRKQMIDKACNWLYDYNKQQAKHGARALLSIGDFTINVDAFRQAMED